VKVEENGSEQVVDARVDEQRKRMDEGRLATAGEGRHKWSRGRW
jgi:hypothetical protein